MWESLCKIYSTSSVTSVFSLSDNAESNSCTNTRLRDSSVIIYYLLLYLPLHTQEIYEYSIVREFVYKTKLQISTSTLRGIISSIDVLEKSKIIYECRMISEPNKHEQTIRALNYHEQKITTLNDYEQKISALNDHE